MFVAMNPALLFLAMLIVWLPGGGCASPAPPQPNNTVTKEALSEGNSQDTRQLSRPVTDAVAVTARLHAIAVEGKLADLRWPDFSDYHVGGVACLPASPGFAFVCCSNRPGRPIVESRAA
jgi:hypothetical protein